MELKKPIASLSLDLDNQWSYLKTHGDIRWTSFPSYLDVLVPRVLRLLEEHGLTITVFVVGQDAALEENRAALRSIAAAGHEIGNHSFHHEPWLLHQHDEHCVEGELARADEHIENTTGLRPLGFRGPGFACSQSILRVLVRRGYLYDSSTFPSILGPLAGMYYVLGARLAPQERRQRREIFGSLGDGLRPLRPYRWRVAPELLDPRPPTRPRPELIEIPVTTMPILKIPIHLSYIMYISAVSPVLALAYFRTALWLCRLARIQPSLLLHPTDFLGCDDVEDLSFFPGMSLPREKKLRVLGQVLRLLSEQFAVVTLQQHASELMQSSCLPLVAPNFGPSQSLPVSLFSGSDC